MKALQSTEAGGHILNEQVSGGELPGFLGIHQPSFLPTATQSFGKNMILEKKKNFKVCLLKQSFPGYKVPFKHWGHHGGPRNVCGQTQGNTLTRGLAQLGKHLLRSDIAQTVGDDLVLPDSLLCLKILLAIVIILHTS